MLNNPQEITDFKDYQAAGGLQKPKGYDIANAVIKAAESVNNAFSESVDDALNYETDGIQALPDSLKLLASEAGEGGSAAMALVTYLDLAANPTDLEQVSIGTDILCKMANVENNKPAPSIVPITDPSLVTQLQGAIDPLSDLVPDVTALMAKINEAITPPPAPPTPTKAKTPPSVLPPPPLPEDLKQQALDMIDELAPYHGEALTFAVMVSEQAKTATSEREKALKAFNDCIAFTMLNSQKTKPSVSGAADAMYPKKKRKKTVQMQG